MTREEFYKLTDILNTEVLGSFMHGGETAELIAMFEEVVEHSNILEQEEPVSEKKCMFTKDSYTDEDRKVLCKDCDEKCEYSKKEEPVSEELEDAAIQICQKVLKGETIIIDGYEYVVLSDAEECFKAGAQWQQEQMIKDAVDACVTDIRIYKEENEVDFTVMYEKGIIPYEIEQQVKVIVIKED